MSGPVGADVLVDIAPLLQRLMALDDSQAAAYFDGDLAIKHTDGWLIGMAVYQDDQWWVDFTNYGAERPTDAGREATDG